MMARTWLIAAVWLAALAACGTRSAEAARWLDAETMKAALHTATPEEDGFIDYVVSLANKGRLPRRLVVTTFIWARKKPRWKFQYFRIGLIIRARRRGIRL